MKNKILFLTLCILILLNSIVFASPSSEPNVLAPAALLIDGTTGQVLFEKNSDEIRYPASTTKVMTALLLLEEGDLDKIVEINDDVPDLITWDSSQIYLIPGEKLTREQLLYALMVASANDAAVAIAQDISGSVEKFVQRMNERAKELGALDTNFVNPHGLHDDDHYTTAQDLGKIALEAMKHPKFREVASTVRYIIPETEKQDTRYLYVTNRLLRNTTYRNFQYEGATGIKTGYTGKARSTLIGGASRDNLDLITVVLNTDSNQVYQDTHSLLDYGFENFTRKVAVNQGDMIEEIDFENAKEPISLIANKTLEYAIFKNSTDEIHSSLQLFENISLPINKGEVVASMVYSLNGVEIDSIPLVSDKNIEAINPIIRFFSKLSIGNWILIALGIFLLYRTYVYMQKKRKRTRRQMFPMKKKYKMFQ